MNTYESPTIVELGSVEDFTRGSGDQHNWDSNWGPAGIFGFVFGNGGSDPGVS